MPQNHYGAGKDPKVSAQLAHGSCELHINAAGTLLAGAAEVGVQPEFPDICGMKCWESVMMRHQRRQPGTEESEEK